MKNVFIFSFLIISGILSAQNKKATMEDGKKVILKADKTWEFADKATESICKVETGFKEPKGGNKLKKHISVDLGCPESDIYLLEVSETMGNGVYIVCVCGTKYKYRKSGSVYYKDGDNPLGLN